MANRTPKDMTMQELHELLLMVQTELQEREGNPALIERARELYGSEDCEIDDSAILSPGDGGTWVAALVWVEDEGEEDES